MASSDDRLPPGEDPPLPQDPLGDKIADVRASISKRLEQVAADAERWQIAEHESAVARLVEELRTEVARAEGTLRQRLEAAAEHRHGDLAEKLSAELAGAVRREMETVSGRLRSDALARAEELESNLMAKATAFESALGTQIEASITSWKFGARDEVLHSVRAEAIDLLEGRLAAVAGDLAAANAAAVKSELSVARSKLSRQVKKRHSKAAGKLEAALEARLVRAEKTLKRRTSVEIEVATTSVQDELDAELAKARAQIKAGVAEAQELLIACTDKSRTEISRSAERARLDEALEKVRTESAERLGEEWTAFRSSMEATRQTLEKAIAELGRRKIRQEAKLARVETSRRITSALETLEVRATSVISELDARLGRSSREIKATVADAEAVAAEAASEIRAAHGKAGERLGDALRRVEDTVTSVEASRGRVAELERRAKAAEAEATRSAEMARNAVELETRMREALNLEAAAAEQITLAERRLIDFVERV
ncbi:MAG: hypothetical protein M3355_11420 [Actinomycetota bacterium]|nr:hypothetical protein [Actinomycetota bacterium]